MSLAHTNPIAFIATTDRTRAKPFYSEILGLPLISEDYFAVVYDLNGIMLRMTTVPDHKPVPHTILGWAVADIEESVASLTAKGVTFAIIPGLQQEPSGIWASPSSAKVAWFHDPDGNGLSLTQF